jgi:uncharacterized protein (UPF0333 family)
MYSNNSSELASPTLAPKQKSSIQTKSNTKNRITSPSSKAKLDLKKRKTISILESPLKTNLKQLSIKEDTKNSNTVEFKKMKSTREPSGRNSIGGISSSSGIQN